VGFGDVQRVDDARLIVDDCQMVSYEIAVKGVGFNFFDLRRTCDSQIIEGTQRVFNLASNTVPSLQVVRFNFDPPIPLNTDEVYLGFKNSSNSAGAVVTQIPPIIGESSADYWTQSESGCATVPRNELVHGAINLAITCAGTLPLGACCDPYLTECDAGADAGKRCNTNTDCASPGTCEAVCRETTKLNCPRRAAANPQWVENEVCGPDAFGKHACGIAACCHRTDDDDLVCENLTKNECNQTEPTDRHWQLGRYCGEGAQFCPITDVCLDTVGSCFESRETPGCDIYSCCALVCSLGPTGAFCCEVAWDSVCVALVETHEPYCPKQQCPVGEVDFVEPPNSVVDARRPYPPDSPQATEGIKAIVATGPIGATADCWSICESPAVPASIQIARVDEAPPGIYTVQLNRTITPGAVTMLTYMDSESHKTVGRFIAHPGNVNGDSRMNAYDILVLVDFLNGVSPLPWGLYSGDLDHSGVIAPTDILTLIDLLNGTNGFAEWYGTALPDVEECP
jgi:hypothetical protein